LVEMQNLAALRRPIGARHDHTRSGQNVRDEWGLDWSWLHVNHGSFGAAPLAVSEVQQDWRHHMEADPSRFVLRVLPEALRAAAEKLGAFLGADAVSLLCRQLNTEPGAEDTMAASMGWSGFRLPSPPHPSARRSCVSDYWIGAPMRRFTRSMVESGCESPRMLITRSKITNGSRRLSEGCDYRGNPRMASHRVAEYRRCGPTSEISKLIC
jgi:hypothetical protein